MHFNDIMDILEVFISDPAKPAASMLQSGGLAGLSRHATAAAAAVAAPGGTCGVRRAISTSVVACSGQRERQEAFHNLPLSNVRLARRRLSTTSAVTMESAPMPSLTLDNMNPAIKKMEYAVRGPLVIRATAIEKELEKVLKSYVRWHCQSAKTYQYMKLMLD